jgi:hypothetical protein
MHGAERMGEACTLQHGLGLEYVTTDLSMCAGAPASRGGAAGTAAGRRARSSRRQHIRGRQQQGRQQHRSTSSPAVIGHCAAEGGVWGACSGRSGVGESALASPTRSAASRLPSKHTSIGCTRQPTHKILLVGVVGSEWEQHADVFHAASGANYRHRCTCTSAPAGLGPLVLWAAHQLWMALSVTTPGQPHSAAPHNQVVIARSGSHAC